MSIPSEQDHLDPRNPVYYAPSSLREGSRFRITRSDDAEPGPPGNGASPPSSFETLLMEAVRKSTGIPLDAEDIDQPPGYGWWTEWISVASWSAVAVGGLALIALFFLIVIPASQSHAPDGNASGAMESLKTALRQAPREDPSKPALADFATSLAIDRAAQPAQPAVTPAQSEALLHRFLQWQQKLDATDSHPGSGSGDQGESESVK
jgi:hypothetical protein